MATSEAGLVSRTVPAAVGVFIRLEVRALLIILSEVVALGSPGRPLIVAIGLSEEEIGRNVDEILANDSNEPKAKVEVSLMEVARVEALLWETFEGMGARL